MQHTPGVRLPSEQREPDWLYALVVILFLGAVIGLVLYVQSRPAGVTLQPSTGVYADPELPAHKRYQAAQARVEHDFPASNPEVGLYLNREAWEESSGR